MCIDASFGMAPVFLAKGFRMRRSIFVVLALALLASLSSTAEARSLKVRRDPNDSTWRMDIRRVVTDLSGSAVYVQIDSWQQFTRRSDDGGFYTVVLDSSGIPRFDRLIWIDNGFCEVSRITENGEPGRVVGTRRWTRMNKRSITCIVPRSWFPRIRRAVRFRVHLIGNNHYRDRAPNRGLYIWL